MQRVFVLVMALFVLTCNAAKAVNINKFSDDSKIISALKVLDETGSHDVFARLERNNIEIMFYDLSLIDYSYAKHYAVASTDNYGNDVILINSKFRNSPKEAIACLIAHESVHELEQATLAEEVRATTTEAQTWIRIRNANCSKCTNALTQRLNSLANLYQHSTPGHNLIKEAIATNSFYKKQLAMN